MHKSILAFAAVCALLITSCSDVPESFNHRVNPSKMGVTQDRIEALDDVLQGFVDEEKVSCVTAFVAKGGNVVYEKSFGYKDIENKIPASPDDIYVLFSQTKAIVAVALMTLYEQGKCGLDDPIYHYIPEFTEKVLVSVEDDGNYVSVPAERPVTISHLLSHSSGYPAGGSPHHGRRGRRVLQVLPAGLPAWNGMELQLRHGRNRLPGGDPFGQDPAGIP